jgi:hypothetical protein
LTSPWNPPGHEPTIEYVAEQARLPGGVVVGGVVVGGVVGVVVGGVVGLVVGGVVGVVVGVVDEP